MASIEEALTRLDGVEYVSAGWKTDSAYVVARSGFTLDRGAVEAAVKKAGFRVESMTRVE